ncbi:hypothetical protein FKM82_005772 [Ascaphus truei]
MKRNASQVSNPLSQFITHRVMTFIQEKEDIEYQLDSQSLRPCELAREKTFLNGEDYIPQCSTDGLYRNLQCNKNGRTCWCVHANSTEVPGSRQIGSPAICLSFCQLKKQQILVSGYINSTSTSHIPQCRDSGEFESVQCNQDLRQCWCVDSDGMEIYGTRQTGKPAQCPQSCEIRDRRILHGVGEKTPPHCSDDGEFFPAQCKLVNTTDKMVVDVVTSFSRFPNAFQSFTSLRESFPEISGYCYCVDSLGRELEGTGLELLLGEVYDTVFAGLSPSRTFTETVIYRILQRRFLAVQLILSGRFRCPSTCEVQRFTASQTGDIFVPSCDDNGDFQSVQCQTGGQCWCVDSKGREIYGTRKQGGSPNYNGQDCPFRRRQALSSLLYGPTGHFGQHSLFVTQEKELGDKINKKYCSSYIVDTFVKSGLLLPIREKTKDNKLQLGSMISEMVSGLFPSKELVQVALKFTSNSKRFQQNLFGGKFLKNMGGFNFTGAIGTRSKFNFSEFFQQIGLTGRYSGGNFQELAKLFSAEEDSYLSRESSNFSKQIFNLNQPIQGSFGRMVNLQENQNLVATFASLLELKEFSVFLRHVISVSPSVAESVKIIMQSMDCEERNSDLYVPSCTKGGRYEEIQCSKSECWCVDDQGREIQMSRIQGKHPRCPTECEKLLERQKVMKNSLPAGSELFIPSCDQKGDFMTVQCAGKSCFCVDLEGRNIPGTRRVSGESIKCPSNCQLAAGKAFLLTTRLLLSDFGAVSQLSSVYIPQCTDDGKWRPVQCNGPTEQAFALYEVWRMLNIGNINISFSETLNEIQKYKNTSLQSFSTFVGTLYSNGYQHLFPVFSKYPFFNDIPKEVLDGNITTLSDNILLNPYVFWRLLNGRLTHYPGSYSDFAVPLGHFELRNCWCVDVDGQKLRGTEMMQNKVPKCPGTCELAKWMTLQFIEEAEELIAASNISNFPLGHVFLIANGIRLTESDLFHADDFFKSGIAFSERFLSRDNYVLQLAAQSTLHFYWQRRFASRRSFGETTQLGYLPYIPQCDGMGNWDPLQFYESTGHYWCVDEDGNYITGSLVTRMSRPPQCQTSCQRGRTNALISSWIPRGSQTKLSNTPTAFIPSCTESGEYSILQKSETNSWCVTPKTGDVVLQDSKDLNSSAECPSYCTLLKSAVTARSLAIGFIPACGEGENLSPVQCEQDGETCYCVFANGEEANGTKVNVSEKEKPSCQSPVCPFSFSARDIQNGAMFCDEILETGEKIQNCQLICRRGYQNVFSSETFVCDLKTLRWVSQSPHLQSCQRVQSFQTVQTQASFQLRLPAGKTCMADYSGSLQAFRTFILDDLKARGLCHIQVNYFGSSGSSTVPVCDDSAVYVECLSTDLLGVNVTWRALLEDIPAPALPDLHDIENAMVGENLVGHLISVIRSGNYSLSLDSKQFLADQSVYFPRDENFNASPQVKLGCVEGFQSKRNSQMNMKTFGGCVICPPGSYFQDEDCTECPAGFYQDQAGSNACLKCPPGKTTAYYGAFNRSHCVTDCQMNDIGLPCDDDGQYLPTQKDVTTNKYYCADISGERIKWTEVDIELTDAQCILLRKFELVPKNKLIYIDEDSRSIQSNQTSGQNLSFLNCIMDCAREESCDYLTVSADGSDVLCKQYNGDESNFNCTPTKQMQNILENSASFSIQHLNCQFKIKGSEKNSLTVYRKKGEEFTRTGLRSFEKTDFRNTISGVYSTMVFSADGTTLTDAHSFCRQTCGQDSCCDGFILSQIILNKGTILCGFLSSSDVLLCNVNDWSETSRLGVDGVCKGVKSNKEQKMFSFFLGGQEFTGSYSMLSKSIGKVEYNTELTAEVKEEIQQLFIRFQRVFLQRGNILSGSATSCSCGRLQSSRASNRDTVVTNQDLSVPNQQYGISKQHYSSKQALAWCLTRCAEEESWCRLVDLQDITREYLTCIIYPDTWNCDKITDLVPDYCGLTLRNKPQLLYRKKEILGNSVRNFYTLVPFRQLTGISVRNQISTSGKSVSNGFFECELQCDADPCCQGFGYFQSSQLTGAEVWCLTLGSLGIQSCSNEATNPWNVMDCSSLNQGMGTHPFGWFQKPESQQTFTSSPCPPVDVPHKAQEVYLDGWLLLDRSSLIIDPSLSTYDVVQISRDSPNNLNTAQNYCLSASTPHVTSVTISSHGTVLGKSHLILIGSSMKNVAQFLGIPYAAPPVGVNRFRPPQPLNWTGTFNATTSRASCLQPGDGKAQYSSVSEDCLYLNVFVPQNIGLNKAVMLYFHNSPSDYSVNGQTFIDGSYQAAIGNIIVVTASYRVGVFGFLSTGSTVPIGNWGLLDQVAALNWVQENIAYFGGDPGLISIAAHGAGADIASVHLLMPETRPFRRALLMGGSAFSPMLVISERRAQEQASFLANDVGCSSAGNEDILTCLRSLDADVLNAAQTKLLAVRGPFQTWGPVVDHFYVREKPSKLLQQGMFQKIDLFTGSAEQDGLISRAKAIKRFEETQGRGDSKIAFYQALQNSLGGEELNSLVRDAAVWFYSLQHSTDDYSGFSRALENSTRDHFIACPVVQMARHWSENSKGNVFMYHVPESFAQSSSGLDLPEDVIYAFGLPFHPNYKNQFSTEEQNLSLKIMQYVTNFVRTGNPNFPYTFSRKVTRTLPTWPVLLAHNNGDNFKEWSRLLLNHQGLKKAECSFWNEYIQSLKAASNAQSDIPPTKNSLGSILAGGFISTATQSRPKEEKDAYN